MRGSKVSAPRKPAWHKASCYLAENPTLSASHCDPVAGEPATGFFIFGADTASRVTAYLWGSVLTYVQKRLQVEAGGWSW
jgi:hypothetical protein